ncbi:MAG: DUF1727 domain-containing protein [Ruminococcaceae bacterium]|nr:DUF1727 domain-containing protein [Oscillospiraceae bacterium]
MGKLRFLLALWMAKLSIPALKITRHNGTDFPGSLALKLCPDFLRYVGKPETIVAITGTNGKTTVSNMLSGILERDGHKVITNRSGSNIISGVATALLRGCNLLGKVTRYDIAILEVDERSSLRIYPHVQPDYLAVTNICRDSTMRHAHPDFIAGIISRAVPTKTQLILNADDLISDTIAPTNPRVYFGIDRMDGDVTECVNLLNDRKICPVCHSKLTYTYRRYHHIGHAVCPSCGFHSPEAQYLARQVDVAQGTMLLQEGEQQFSYPLINDSIFNIYNMVTVIAVLRQLGYSQEQVQHFMAQTSIPSSRHNEHKIGQFSVITQMSKGLNAFATSRAFDYIAGRPGKKEIFLMINDQACERRWSENICWLYDTDFEFLNRDDIVQIVCTGKRGLDYKLRMLLAGIPEDRIHYEEDNLKALELLQFRPGDDIYLLHDVEEDHTQRIFDRLAQLAAEHSSEEVQA